MTVARSDERGAAMVMFAITLIVLMGMSGFAVDLGMLFAERRQDQSAADAGVLGGGLDLSLGVSAATNKAAEIVRLNLSTDYTDTEWAAAWGACVDDDAFFFTGDVLGTATECISADGLGTFRVVVPDQTVPTAFAGVFGFDSFTTSAIAEASLTIQGLGGVLPFALLGNAGSGPGGSEICMRSAAGGQAVAPCDGSIDSGNFGALQIGQWGNPAVGTEALCGINKGDELAVNISVGIDHFVRIWANPPGDVVDDCANKLYGPNALPTFQGLGTGLVEGLITGLSVSNSSFPGRLGLGTTDKLYIDNNVYGVHPIDNAPLWEYIGYGHTTAELPTSCLRETFDAISHANANANISTCLSDYASGTGFVVLFGYDANGDDIPDITLSPRFAVVPQFNENNLGNGNSKVLTIREYRAVFLQALYFGCNGRGCSIIVTPDPSLDGQTISVSNGNSPLDQVTAHLLPYSSIDDSLVENGIDGNLGSYQLRLSK